MKYIILILLISSIMISGCVEYPTFENATTNPSSALMIVGIDCAHRVICYRDKDATTYTFGCTYVPLDNLNECKQIVLNGG